MISLENSEQILWELWKSGDNSIQCSFNINVFFTLLLLLLLMIFLWLLLETHFSQATSKANWYINKQFSTEKEKKKKQ